MPIECDIEIIAVSQDKFHQLDRSVMRHAFDIHNSMGRFCDERIYQDELASRCSSSGFESVREVEIRLIHGSFSKSYFADLMVDRSVIYELKAAESITPAHQNQLINYLLLTNTRHGKLLNLRASSVQPRFVSTTMTRQDRREYRLNATRRNGDTAADHLLDCLIRIIEDWGVGLDLAAYREALLHFTSGPNTGLLPVAIKTQDRIIGTQKMCLLTPETAWHLSAVKSNLASHEKHIRRLLAHTSLNCLHWINLNQNDVNLRTIQNDSVIK